MLCIAIFLIDRAPLLPRPMEECAPETMSENSANPVGRPRWHQPLRTRDPDLMTTVDHRSGGTGTIDPIPLEFESLAGAV